MSENQKAEKTSRYRWNSGVTHPYSSSSMCGVKRGKNNRSAERKILKRRLTFLLSPLYNPIDICNKFGNFRNIHNSSYMISFPHWQTAISRAIRNWHISSLPKRNFSSLITNTSQQAGLKSNEWGYCWCILISFYIKIYIQSKNQSQNTTASSIFTLWSNVKLTSDIHWDLQHRSNVWHLSRKLLLTARDRQNYWVVGLCLSSGF